LWQDHGSRGFDLVHVGQFRGIGSASQPSPDYRVYVDGKEIRVYTAAVYNWRDPENLFPVVGMPYSRVAFAGFDCTQEAEVRVVCLKPPTNAVVRPLSYGIAARNQGNEIRFTAHPTQKLTLEPFGEHAPALHLFADPPESDQPKPGAPNLIYYGPGVHELTHLELKSNQTLYLARGAILKAVVGPEEKPLRFETRVTGPTKVKLARYQHFISASNATNITICGRGIVDLTAITLAGGRKNPISLSRCQNVRIEGITIRHAPCWNLTLYRCENATVENYKAISAFYNSDGLNLVSSRHVTVRHCFLRNRDDGFVVKAMDTGNTDCFLTEPPRELPGGKVTDIDVADCVIWSDWGYALSAAYELRKPIERVRFENCDVINATHANPEQGVLGILLSDKGLVRDVQFDNIRIERSLKPLVKLAITHTKWSVSKVLGSMENISFKNIRVGETRVPLIDIENTSPDGWIRDIVGENIVVDKSVGTGPLFSVAGNVSRVNLSLTVNGKPASLMRPPQGR
jgi:Glycosyl hydrolases family 28